MKPIPFANRQCMRSFVLGFFFVMIGWLVLVPSVNAQNTNPDTPLIAIMSAFEPELKRLLAQTEVEETRRINGIDFTVGTLKEQPVVLFLSGISMVNAAMTTQLVIDKFPIEAIVFSGIAGGVDPALNIGDVVVAERWGQYLEALFARKNPDADVEGEAYLPPEGKSGLGYKNFGMIFPRRVRVRSASQPEIHEKFWFEVDSQLMARAQGLDNIELQACSEPQTCLSSTPKVVIGGNGVSGAVFVDNARFRQYALETFDASVLDMESAACATVAYSNDIPFIAFRSLSDLAGGGPGENEMHTFLEIAAENSARVVLRYLEGWDDHTAP